MLVEVCPAGGAFRDGERRSEAFNGPTSVPDRVPKTVSNDRPDQWETTRAAIRIGCLGERGGTRTHDHMIKSHVLYQLSYALARVECDEPSTRRRET